MAAGLARVRAVIDRIAAEVDEFARARRAQDLDTAAVLPDPRAERRRRLAEPDLEFRAFCARRRLPASSTPQLARAWDAWQAERYGVARSASGPATPTTRSGHADHPPAVPAFRKLDGIAVLTARLLPARPGHLEQQLRAAGGGDDQLGQPVAHSLEYLGQSRRLVLPFGGVACPARAASTALAASATPCSRSVNRSMSSVGRSMTPCAIRALPPLRAKPYTVYAGGVADG